MQLHITLLLPRLSLQSLSLVFPDWVCEVPTVQESTGFRQGPSFIQAVLGPSEVLICAEFLHQKSVLVLTLILIQI
jgi:hypothetical protein